MTNLLGRKRYSQALIHTVHKERKKVAKKERNTAATFEYLFY